MELESVLKAIRPVVQRGLVGANPACGKAASCITVDVEVATRWGQGNSDVEGIQQRWMQVLSDAKYQDIW